jgi:carbonic anhydrase
MKTFCLLFLFPLLTFAKEKPAPTGKSPISHVATGQAPSVVHAKGGANTTTESSLQSARRANSNHGAHGSPADHGAQGAHGANAAHAAHGAEASRMTGWEAFSELQDGNMRFHEGKARHIRQDVPVREGLANGQKPHTILISCSDSRLPPELIFDQGLGDLFVVRLAGNVVNDEAVASIEYAVSHLGAKLLIVMGHESCGAVGAAIGTKPGASAGSQSLDVLVKHIRAHLSDEAVSSAGGDKSFRLPVKENVAATMNELLQQSEIVRRAVATEGLVLGQAIYSLRTGRVEFWELGQKVTLQSPAPSVVVGDGPAIPEQVVKEEIVTDKKAPPVKAVKGKSKPEASSVH